MRRITETSEGQGKLICLDFDGVIHSYVSGWKGQEVVTDPPVPGAFKFITDALARGYKVGIYSARLSNDAGKMAVYRYLEDRGMWKESLSQIQFFHTKPPAHIYIDDRGWKFNGFFPSFQEIEEFKSWVDKTGN